MTQKTTLQILDQCNVRFRNLDPFVRRQIVEKLKFFVPYARHMPAFKLGRWDGKVAFATAGGGTYLNLLDRVLPLVIDAGYEIDIEDLRPPMNVVFETIDEEYLADRVWPKGHAMEGEPIMLRDYQVDAINTFFKPENHQSIQELSTGAGKTILCAAMSRACEKYGKTLVIVPSKSLVVQTEADYINCGLDVGVFFGDRKDIDKTHTIATWQSIESWAKASRHGEAEIPISAIVDDAVCVIVDECLHGDTLVLTDSGPRPIKDIKVGDIIINYSQECRTFKKDIVKDTYCNMPLSSGEDMLELEFDNGRTVRVTANHKFLTERGWVRADSITYTDEIISFGDFL